MFTTSPVSANSACCTVAVGAASCTVAAGAPVGTAVSVWMGAAWSTGGGPDRRAVSTRTASSRAVSARTACSASLIERRVGTGTSRAEGGSAFRIERWVITGPSTGERSTSAATTFDCPEGTGESARFSTGFGAMITGVGAPGTST